MSGEEFATALAAFQSELPHIGKGSKATVPTKNGGSYSYDYAALPDILDATLPLLTSHGLAFTATPTVTEHGFVLRFALVHTAGHREEGSYPLPDPERSTPQQIGSAITYGRRYCFTAVTGIAPDEDDDGQAASESRSRARKTPEPERTTDTEWLASARRLLVAATTVEEVGALWRQTASKYAAHALTADDRRDFEHEMTERKQELTGEVVPA